MPEDQDVSKPKTTSAEVLSGISLALLLSIAVFGYTVIRDIRSDLMAEVNQCRQEQREHERMGGHYSTQRDLGILEERISQIERRLDGKTNYQDHSSYYGSAIQVSQCHLDQETSHSF